MTDSTISAKQVFAYVIKMISQFKIALGIIVCVNILWAIDISIRPYIIKVILNRIHELPANEMTKGLLIPAIAYIAASFVMTTSFGIPNQL